MTTQPAPQIEVHGHCDPRFEAVREEFIRNFRERGDLGAATAVCLDGEMVVDLWAGYRDAARTLPWERDTISPVWSVGKAMSALAVLRLVQAGLVEIEAPVARYWPEFAQAGKGDITMRLLMSHQAGLPAVAKPLEPGIHLTSWETMTDALAEQAPWWEPGKGHGYHTNTIGFLLGEVVRRVTGRRIRDVIAEDIAGLLEVEFIVGTKPEDDARTAEWVPYKPAEGEVVPPRNPAANIDPATATGLDLMRVMVAKNPAASPGGVTSRVWRAAEFPSTNPHSNARSIARIFGALASGTLLDPSLVDRARTEEADGEDLVLLRPTRFGLGFQLAMPEIRPLGPNPRAFGHYGNGAVVGICDPEAGLGFSYTCNQSGRSWRDPRNIALIDALFASMA